MGVGGEPQHQSLPWPRGQSRQKLPVPSPREGLTWAQRLSGGQGLKRDGEVPFGAARPRERLRAS